MTREEILSQIVKMITSDEIPKEIYNKYLSMTPIGFMSYDELLNYLKKEKGKEEELMSAKEFSENELLFNELYDKTKDCGRVQFINLLMEKEREIKELKEQLEKKYEKAGTLTGELLYEENTKLINQQKEFIRLLEKEIVDSSAGSGQQYYAQQHLRLFKEIIGDKE